MTVELERVVPILRTFDTDLATSFYVEYLGMTVDWEHRFGPDFPRYRQVSRGDLVLHLSEHHGDSTPGSAVYVRVVGVRELHEELMQRWTVGRNRPELVEQEWAALEFTVIDPFGNKLRFGQSR